MYSALLLVHIVGGFASLLSAAVAAGAPKGDRWHVYAGRVFVLAMAVIFATAVPMTFLRPNLFLLLVALFSFYQALSGWLRARNRSGTPTPIEWATAGIMAVTAVVMAARGAWLLGIGQSMGLVLLAFGGIGGALAAQDLRSLRARRYVGTTRIAAHLGRMMGGTIAAVTAFAVVNIRIEPQFIVWLAPAMVITPLIVYWTARVRRARAPVGRGETAPVERRETAPVAHARRAS